MDPVEARVFSHTLRVRILAALSVEPASVTMLSRGLSQPLSKIAYHVALLCHTGYAALVPGQDPDTPDPLYELTGW